MENKALEELKKQLETQKNELTDEDLKGVTGGAQTGDVNDKGEVYIAFPSIVSSLSGYYNTEGITKLCEDYIGWAKIIQPFITDDVRKAVSDLFERNNIAIPQVVKDLLGI